MSISGGFIETDLKLSECARVNIEFVQVRDGVAQRHFWHSHVVRTGFSGLAVEWCEVAADDVLTLIARSRAGRLPRGAEVSLAGLEGPAARGFL